MKLLHICLPYNLLGEYRVSGLIKGIGDFNQLSAVDTIIITAPTPLNDHREPYMCFIKIAFEIIAKCLKMVPLVV